MNVAPKTVSASAPSLIEINNVYKQYGTGVVAVRDMSLNIEQGQFVSFLGPSGCGKSTALRMIAGLISVSAGTIRVNGHAPGQAGGAQDIGFVFQEPTLMPWATVFDNVYLPLRLSGVSTQQARPRVEEALAQVGKNRAARLANLERLRQSGMSAREARADFLAQRAAAAKP